MRVWVAVNIVRGGVWVAVSIVRGGVWVAVSIVRGGVWADISLREVVEKLVVGCELEKSLGLVK